MMLIVFALWVGTGSNTLVSAAGATCRMAVSQNTKCTAGRYAASAVADVDACCVVCAAEAQCVQWTFHGGGDTQNCDRVNTTAKKQKLPGATCGDKKATPAPPAPIPTPPAPNPPPTPPVPPAGLINLNFSWAVLPTWIKLLVSNNSSAHRT
jgi:hypothetical protein